mgnify:CR=1 FL=1
MRIEFQVNGTAVAAEVEPRTSLVDFLRDTLRLTGTHIGCEHGVCGACTVIVGGAAVRSCLMLAVQAEGEKAEEKADEEEKEKAEAEARPHRLPEPGSWAGSRSQAPYC